MKAKKEIPKTGTTELADKALEKSPNLFPVVGIGASAGGLDAFKKLLKAIPEDSGMAYVLVQHLDPTHESLLPEILQKVTKVPVLEITDDIKVQPDHIYIMPANKMMVANDGILVLAPRPAKSLTGRNLPIDLFFSSLAEVHQEHAIGVVLSGTASDGTQGLKAIKEQGGITFAQDEASAEYEGMPNSAAQAGVVDFILPPEEIPKKLLEVTSKSILSDEELQNIPKQDEDVFKQILSLLRIRKGVDFTYYKQTTIRRRILRRMVVNKNEEPADYLKFLRGSTAEQDLLYQDMLIPVTSFFRDKKVFENLCNNVFPTIVKNKVPGAITRVWVAGCSTGQEVYSFAICFNEFLGDNHERIQIFGTDLSEPAILKARTGIYEKTELDSVSPQRLKEYFTKHNGGYQVNKSIRDMCVFAHHNFLKDPPFGKMDCISCRNVLIYLEPYLQKKALTTFHYALNPRGFLLLGKSETTGGVPDLFAAVEKSDKLYTRKDVPGRFIQVTSQRSEQILSRANEHSKIETIRTDFQKTADDILLTKYTPAGVVVNEAMDIVHFRGNTGNYLEQAPGKPSHNLLTMAKHGLAFELRNILHKAKTDKAAVVKENIPLQVNGSLRTISIEAVPLPNTVEPYYLVLFHDHNLTDAAGLVTVSKRKVSAKNKQDEKDLRIQLLEQELSQLREDMRSITEDQESSNEELQSANEELLSGSEELQSLNEELETSKEELQSTNEELTVLNHELTGLNEQVTDARNYSESIVATLYQPLLVLDKHLRVKTANKAFYKTFNVNEQETEGVLIYDLGNRQWNIPELRILLEEVLPQKKQISDFEVTHNFTSIGERIILLNALEITREKKEEKLILLSIEDITERNHAQKKIEVSEHRYHEMIYSSPSLMAILKGEDMIIEIANNAMLESWGKGKYLIGKSIFDAVPETVEQGFDKLLLSAYKTGQPVRAYEAPVTMLRNGTKELVYYNFIYQAQRNVKGEIEGVAIIANEVTPQAALNKKIKESEAFNRAVLESSPDCIKILDAEGRLQYMNVNGICLLEIDDFEPLKNTYWWDMWEPDNQQTIKDAVATAKRGKKIQLQLFGTTIKGTPKWWDIIVLPVLQDESGKKLHQILAVSRDITRQKLNELKEKELLTRFQNLIMQAPVAICVLRGKDYVIETMNEGMSVFWDRTADQALNKPVFDVLPELRDQRIKELLDNVYNTGERFVMQELSINLTRNGKLENAFVKFVYEPLREADGSISGVMALAHEITEQVSLRKKIEVSEKRFQAAVAALAGIVWTNNEKGEMEGEQIGWSSLTGQSYQEYRGYGWVNAVHPDDAQPTMEAWNEAVRQRGNFVFEHRVKLKNGDWGHFSVKAIPLLNADGLIWEWVGVHTDITEQHKAEKAVRESEERFRQMAELMPQKVWTADAKGHKNYFNKTLLDYAGYSYEELVGNGWQKIVHPDDWGKNKDQWEESINTGKDYETENRLLRKDGEYLWHLTRAVAIKDEDGEIKMWVGSKTEIQEQRAEKEELEEKVQDRTSQLIAANKELQTKNTELFIAREKLMSEYSRSLIEASLDPLVTINTEGKITDMNQATVDITGLSGKKLTGSNFLAYFTEPQKAREVYEQVFAKGSVINAPLTIRHVDGKLTDIFLNGSVYKNPSGDIAGVVLVARDVTEEKRIAKELTEAIVFAELATGIAEDAKAKAEEAVKAKQQFLSNMSHEIRTPMNAIIGFTKVVLKTDLSAKQKEYLNAIKLSGDSLIVLINDILDLAKVDAGKMTFEAIPFKMASSIAAMIHLFDTKIQEKNLELGQDYDDTIPEVLLGDPVRLHQIILNLLSNAVKFTSKGKITISTHLIKEDAENATIKFSVADTGTGIPTDKTEKIFEKFHQASSDTSRLYGGTGLGLAIVKQLVESQGGHIEVESKPGVGSVFSFTLDFKKTDAAAETETEMLEIDPENKNIKVLVAEDIALNQLLMKTLLDDFGFERDIAGNGKIAIEKMQEKNYDIILMDLQMPEMNGFEATEYIRNTLHSKIPIIALTADVTTVDLEKCKSVGMNDYIAKPVDEKILYSKIIGLVMKPAEKTNRRITLAGNTLAGKDTEKYTDLAYLIGITKYDHSLMMQMIAMYLDQTPVLMNTIKKSMQQKDWQSLQAAAHKMIPSFSIMGISEEYEKMAKRMQAYTGTKKEAAEIKILVDKLDAVCNLACKELTEEYNILKNTNA